MKKIQFEEESWIKKSRVRKPITTENFGLATFLLRHGLVKTTQGAKTVSKALLLFLVVVAIVVMFMMSTIGAESQIDDSYFYDPTRTDDL